MCITVNKDVYILNSSAIDVRASIAYLRAKTVILFCFMYIKLSTNITHLYRTFLRYFDVKKQLGEGYRGHA